jgi:hypothetical protein
MPGYSSAYGKKGMKGNEPMKRKDKAVKKITKRQEDALEKHSEHHTAKHMAMMRKLMREGKTFTDAHRLTQKAIGR